MGNFKIYYLNDEKDSVTIRTIEPDGENTFTTLLPQEGRVFKITAPDGAVPFVKRWDNRTILLGYTSEPSIVNA